MAPRAWGRTGIMSGSSLPASSIVRMAEIKCYPDRARSGEVCPQKEVLSGAKSARETPSDCARARKGCEEGFPTHAIGPQAPSHPGWHNVGIIAASSTPPWRAPDWCLLHRAQHLWKPHSTEFSGAV